MKEVSFRPDARMPPLSIAERAGQSLYRFALTCIGPIDYATTRSLRAFSTAILPGQFDNLSTYGLELVRRVAHVAAATLFFPVNLALFAVGNVCESMGSIMHQRPYYYLKGQIEEKKENSSSFRLLSGNACMLPYGISYLAGIAHPTERVDLLAEQILSGEADFVLLQEMSTPYALQLWERLTPHYAHGLTRVGPMPYTRMENSLFVASKYPIEEVRYHPLTNTGAIVRGVLCVKTSAGWLLNAHLRQGEENSVIRYKQMEEIAALCEELSQGGSIPCSVYLDSNILRTSQEENEYSKCVPRENFLEGLFVEEPFILGEANATCSNVAGYVIQGKSVPSAIEEKVEWIDHALLYKPCRNLASLQTQLVDIGALSDHKFLSSEILLQK